MPGKPSKRKNQASTEASRILTALTPELQQQVLDLATTFQRLQVDAHTQRADAETAAHDLQRLRTDLDDEVERRKSAELAAASAENSVRQLQDSVRRLQDDLTAANKSDRAVQKALDVFNDPVTLRLMKCPIPVSNGRLMDMESVINLFINGSSKQTIFFNGTLDSKFEDPVTQESVTIMGPEVIRLVHEIAKALGLAIELPHCFEFTQEPMDHEGCVTWEPYAIDDQMRILLQILLMHRERETVQADAMATKTVTVAKRHHITFTRTPQETITYHANPHINNDRDVVETHHNIDYTLCVINVLGRGVQHDIRFNCRVQLDLEKFNFAGVDDYQYDF